MTCVRFFFLVNKSRMAATVAESIEEQGSVPENNIPIVFSARNALPCFHNPPEPGSDDAVNEQVESIEGALILSNAEKTSKWRIDRASFDMERIKCSNSSSQQEVRVISTSGDELNKKLFSRHESTPATNILGDESNEGLVNSVDHLERTFSSPVEARVPDMNPPTQNVHHAKGGTLLLALGALGVVFGDIGTSPLYTIQTIFLSIPVTEDNVIGAISTIFWLLNLAVTLKYVTVIMRADNRGEGGIMALTALASQSPHGLTRPWWKTMTMMIGEQSIVSMS